MKFNVILTYQERKQEMFDIDATSYCYSTPERFAKSLFEDENIPTDLVKISVCQFLSENDSPVSWIASKSKMFFENGNLL